MRYSTSFISLHVTIILMTTLVLTGCRDDTGLSHEESSSNQAKSSENTTSDKTIDSNDGIQLSNMETWRVPFVEFENHKLRE